ncbi:patatin-like protein [Achromobacter sp.]|uniref:patatin-like protein n=1 Tax=Achromobacter sp. TaxID=134375 RepID=UPI002898CFB3|nr:patatin-like protein [Achromobacter sp.]
MPDPINYGSEIRIGVVMYGGVSLAIYINGVTNEMFELVRATQPNGLGDGAGNGKLRTRDVYARLSRLINNEPLRARYAALLETGGEDQDKWMSLMSTPEFDCSCKQAEQPARFVIDVISGTSAGGINGIFLAKALANNEDFSLLQKLWIEEGDIGLLLNDKRSYKQGFDVALTPRGRLPKSLLNSDRMYVKLLDAMRQMSAVTKRPTARNSLVDEIDLFVTTTDISGSRVSLKLFDKVVHEKRHKQCFHFRYCDDGEVNDLKAENNAFLAFAARCTSSFPFAFEPMTLQAVVDLRIVEDQELKRWNDFFAGLSGEEVSSGDHAYRAFGDGGYLDNKPFSYVVNQLAERTADLPIERKLIYVEPSPEPDFDSQPGPDCERASPFEHDVIDSRRKHAPNAVENAAAALLSIPQYETIREDLEAVLHRNRTIERIERIVRLGAADLDRQKTLFMRDINVGDPIPVWSELTMDQVVGLYGHAFIPYFRLRVVTTTDTLAHALAARWAIDRGSSQYQALRMLVWAWREFHYSDSGKAQGNDQSDNRKRETNTAFLAQYDLDYRWRRLGFLLRKVEQTTRVINACGRQGSQVLAPEDESLFTRIEQRNYCAVWFEDPQATLAALQSMKRLLVVWRREITRIRRARIKEELKSELSEARQRELRMVLDVVLGADSTDKELQSVSGRPMRLKLNTELLRKAAAARGAQQAMYCRVQALFQAAHRAPESTALNDELESRITSLRLFGPSADDTLDKNGRALWMCLGNPKLAVWPRGKQSGKEDNSFTEHHAEWIAEKDRSGDACAAKGEVVVEVEDNLSNEVLDLGMTVDCRATLQTPVGRSVRKFISEYYLFFDSFDQISFPLYYDSGAGEPAFVDVVRVSPRDATALVDERDGERKLDGTALANFGAFLDKRWRRNDVLWGRLDGAERLIHSLLPMNDAPTIRICEELTKLAQQAILRESMGADRTQALLQAIQNELAKDDPKRCEELMATLKSALLDSELMQHMRKRKVAHGPEPKATLDSIARGVSVCGKVLEGAAQERGVEGGASGARWLARIGLFFHGLLLVSLPRTWQNNWAQWVVGALYVFEIILLGLSLLIGSQDMRMLAVTAFLITGAAHIVCAIIHDVGLGRRRWRRGAVTRAAAALLLLSVVGAASAFRSVYCDATSSSEKGRESALICAGSAFVAQLVR